jgi:flagellar hook assembly protein FlgD
MDAAGNAGFAEVNFVINSTVPLAFFGVSATTNTINTALSETGTIFYTINDHASVTFKIIPEKQGPTGTPVYQVSQTIQSAGPSSFTWDGRDSTGKVVPDEAYLYFLTATDGVATATYSPVIPAGTGTVSCSQGAGYDPYRNDTLMISYSVALPARVNLFVNLSGSIFKVMDSVPYASGNYTFDWNGRSSNGTILTGGTALAQCAVASLLRENVIITSGDTPKVTLLKTDPYDIQLSYGEFTRITYTLSRDANVTVTLLPTTGAAITFLNNQAQTAGAHEIKWDGVDPSDSSGKKLLISPEGGYTVSIQAVNPVTGASSVAKGSLRIWR